MTICLPACEKDYDQALMRRYGKRTPTWTSSPNICRRVVVAVGCHAYFKRLNPSNRQQQVLCISSSVGIAPSKSVAAEAVGAYEDIDIVG